MHDPNYLARDPEPDETVPADLEAVRVELPWGPLSYGEGAFLTQIVSQERAPAVQAAIALYLQCRAQPIYDPFMHGEITAHLWRVLQAAHPNPYWQWGDWDQAYEDFCRVADEFLTEAKVA